MRIPIPVGDQDPSFGVYAVPGLKTHVFVGPFASKTEVITETIDDDDDDDIVCLDEDPPATNTDKDNVDKGEKEKGTSEEAEANNELTNDDGEDDEISIIEPDPKAEEEKKEKDSRRQKRRLLAQNMKILGQVPLVVTSQKNDKNDGDNDDDDIDIIGVVTPQSKETSQSKQLKMQAANLARKNPLPYSHIPVSQFGKVFYTCSFG